MNEQGRVTPTPTQEERMIARVTPTQEERMIARDLVDAWMPLWVQRALQMESACDDLVRAISQALHKARA